jgi:hypothetical protein
MMPTSQTYDRQQVEEADLNFPLNTLEHLTCLEGRFKRGNISKYCFWDIIVD